MNPIKYPSNPDDLKAFEKAYLKCFSKLNKDSINQYLNKLTFNNAPLTFEKLISLSFTELIELGPEIKEFSLQFTETKKEEDEIVISNSFEDFFNYKKYQPDLACFFMNQNFLDLSACHYCGIDYVNAFCDLEDYEDGLDFLNNASFEELQIVDHIGEEKAKAVIQKREEKKKRKEKFTTYEETGLTDARINLIKDLDFKNDYNHFTLDHFFPQSTHKFYSLCLYNFVPSCSSCNTKFKNDIEFTINENLKNISPTSSDYSLTKDLKFKILYANGLNNLSCESDFTLKVKISRNKDHIRDYLTMFKIQGRYKFHKKTLLEMIQNKQKYSDQKIKNVAKTMGISQKELRSLIFGKDLFDDKITNTPLLKLKRDIGKDLKIKGVK